VVLGVQFQAALEFGERKSMLKMRVYRLSLPLTVMGVELWALGLIGGGGIISLQFYSSILPSILPFPVAAVTGVFLYKIVAIIKRYFPGRAFYHLMTWLTQGDRYTLQRELRCMPLILPGEAVPTGWQPTRRTKSVILESLVHLKE
jgi:hypothetical protein